MPDYAAPGEPAYDLSRSQFIGLRTEILPRLVARCRDADDVRAALDLAAGRDWPYAVRGGGHSNAGHSSSTGLVIDLTPADGIDVSADGRTVSVGGGVRTGALAAALAPWHRLVPAGSCPSVGIVGAALGGGFGSHGRRYGLTCDRLVAADVVLADGRLVSTSPDVESDLLWALRGAGAGRFGVVLRATFATAPATARVHLRLSWPAARAVPLLTWWQQHAPDRPDGDALELVLLAPDHADDEPAVLVVGAVEPGRADALLAELTAVAGEPDVGEVADVAPEDAGRLHATPWSAVADDAWSLPLQSEAPGMIRARTEYVDRPLPADALAALVEHVVGHRVPGELREVAFTPWRGQYAQAPVGGSAFAHRDPAYLVKHTVLVGPNGARRRGGEALAWLDASWAIVHPHGTGAAYPNFPDPALPDPLAAYYGPHQSRLAAVTAHYAG